MTAPPRKAARWPDKNESLPCDPPGQNSDVSVTVEIHRFWEQTRCLGFLSYGDGGSVGRSCRTEHYRQRPLSGIPPQ